MLGVVGFLDQVNDCLVARDIPELQNIVGQWVISPKSWRTTYAITSQYKELILVAQLRLRSVWGADDELLHGGIPKTPGNRENAVHTPAHDEATCVGDALSLLLVGPFVVVRQAYSLAIPREHTTSISSVSAIENAA